MTHASELRAAVAAVRPRLAGWSPDIAMVLGSGLGAMAEAIESAVVVSYDDVPGLDGGRVAGHVGRLVAGTLRGARVLAFAGRRHLYEGCAAASVALPVRLASELGAARLLVTNAAGGIRRTFTPGTLMLIRDHLNFTFRWPLAGAVLPGEERFPDMSAPYDPALGDAMRAAARTAGVRLEEGVYAAVLGPSYETAAEVRMLERFGADAVGMSTVPEVIVAAARGMRVCGVSCITNLAAGLGPPLDHREVLAVTAQVRGEFIALIGTWVEAGARS
ncbi:MAG TPA: purine-nucleoside phosphorylase [Gemmatimonadaceae bacterium]|nr:purine-nucleoside phosphorylase [Gemmatimonadaceae bacterium]